MPSQLERPWRLLRRLSFAVFGAVVLALGFVAIPLSRRLARDGEPDDLRAQRWIHRGARVFVGFMQGIGLMRLEQVGTGRLRAGGPLLVVANHPTIFDLPLILSLMPRRLHRGQAWPRNSSCAGCGGGGYGSHDDGSSVMGRASDSSMRALGRIFPGVRALRREAAGFHAGAAFVALRTGQGLQRCCELPTPTRRREEWYESAAAAVRVRVGSRPAGTCGTVRDLWRRRVITAELRESL